MDWVNKKTKHNTGSVHLDTLIQGLFGSAELGNKLSRSKCWEAVDPEYNPNACYSGTEMFEKYLSQSIKIHLGFTVFTTPGVPTPGMPDKGDFNEKCVD